jgi:hypothetical protein
MFKNLGADSIFLDHYDNGMVAGTPFNSMTGENWVGMTMLSSIGEAVECKYKKMCRKSEKEITKALDESGKNEKIKIKRVDKK